jgi:prolipoprotein diacylglyceryltransferase
VEPRVASPVAIHALFDALAWVTAGLVGWAVARWRPGLVPAPPVDPARLPVLFASAALGAYLFGTLNLLASGMAGFARSIEGALLGGIVGVEAWKWFAGVKARTGARLAAPLAAGIVFGRVGCFLSGLEDFTHGVATSLPWGHDFGDGVSRHPVQIYESLAMAGFLVWYLARLARGSMFVAVNGFSLMVGFYALQRFGWEFIKPYGAMLGPFTVFHLVSAALFVYAAALLRGAVRIGAKV